jgi:hypothetical protein
VTGLVSLTETAAVKSRCFENRCPPSTAGEIGSARGFGLASDVFFGLALAGVGVGVGGIVLSPRDGATPKADDRAPVSAELLMGPGSLLLRGSF